MGEIDDDAAEETAKKGECLHCTLGEAFNGWIERNCPRVEDGQPLVDMHHALDHIGQLAAGIIIKAGDAAPMAFAEFVELTADALRYHGATNITLEVNREPPAGSKLN